MQQPQEHNESIRRPKPAVPAELLRAGYARLTEIGASVAQLQAIVGLEIPQTVVEVPPVVIGDEQVAPSGNAGAVINLTSLQEARSRLEAIHSGQKEVA